MEWDEVQRRKKNLVGEVVKDLSEQERNFLQWLLQEERKYRYAQKGGIRVPKNLREQVELLFPLPKGKAGERAVGEDE